MKMGRSEYNISTNKHSPEGAVHLSVLGHTLRGVASGKKAPY